MARLALALVALALAGCATAKPVNTCGDPPQNLSDDLSGLEYIKRARAWEAFGSCVLDLVEPMPPVVVPVEDPDAIIERERKRREAIFGVLA
jgi:hypothetical protein